MQPTREQLYDCLVSLGVTPTKQQVSDLLKISERYYRNKSVQVPKEKHLEALLNTRNALNNNEVANSPLVNIALARLALNGYRTNSPKQVVQKAFKKAKLDAGDNGRPRKIADDALMTALCLYYREMFAPAAHPYQPQTVSHLPEFKSLKDKNDNVTYEGKGYDFIVTVWRVITDDNIKVKSETIGRYLVDEKSRINLIYNEKK